MSESKYVDIHTHVHFDAFDSDRDEVMGRAADAGVAMINVGTTLETSQAAVTLAEQYQHAYATIGLHPTHTDASAGRDVERFNALKYQTLAQQDKVVAVGECGLDYFRLDEASKKTQQDAFDEQIQFATGIGKPLMLHIRDAYEDAHAILKNHPDATGNVHFFVGTWDEAKLFLDRGFTLSFTGVLTFSSDYNAVVKNAPLDMIMSETDAPYVAPVPHRGKRNEPAYVVEVAKCIAAIREESEQSVAAALSANAVRVFSL